MSKDKKQAPKKEEQKKAAAAKPAEKKVEEKKPSREKKAPEVPPTVEPEVVEKKSTTGKTPVSVANVTDLFNKDKRVASTPESRAIILNLADKRFSRPGIEDLYDPEFLKTMDMIVDAGVVCEIAEEAMFGETTFGRVMKSSMLPKFQLLAKQMGINMPEMKALEAITPAEELKKGNVTVKVDKKDISKETQKQLKKEHEIKKEVPELDPAKVYAAGDEALVKALTYKLVDSKGIGEKLTGVVDFMRQYRAEVARHADNTSDAMLKYDNRTVGEWLDDAFSIVTPTLLFNGIGTGLRLTTSQTGSPVCAFTILKRHIKDQWDDASIASAVTAILRWITTDNIERNEKDIALLPEKERDGEIAAKYKEAIEHNKAILEVATNPNYDFVEKITESDPDKLTDSEKKFRQSLQNFLYPDLKPGMYKNLFSNIQQYAGYVTGLFREAGTADANYQLGNMTELELVEEPSVGEKTEETKKD